MHVNDFSRQHNERGLSCFFAEADLRRADVLARIAENRLAQSEDTPNKTKKAPDKNRMP